MRAPAVAIVVLATLLASGCASLVSNIASDFADSLSAGIKNHDDPETVRAGLPSYMIMMDGFIAKDPDSPLMLAAAADMYASFGAVFVDDDVRARRLTRRGLDYASDAMCNAFADACGWGEMAYPAFEASLGRVGVADANTLYTYGFALLAYIRAHSSDFGALAELPQAEAILVRYIALSGETANPAAFNYLGILQTLRPPALGGKPEQARANFEKAIELTAGQDLSVKVEYAKGYAKTLYDRELHDRLVVEVLEASPYADGFTLSNVLAQQQALELARSADDYF